MRSAVSTNLYSNPLLLSHPRVCQRQEQLPSHRHREAAQLARTGFQSYRNDLGQKGGEEVEKIEHQSQLELSQEFEL